MVVATELLQETASIIADYRAGEIAPPDAAHVGRWLSQFDEAYQAPVITELNHVLKTTYVTKARTETFLSGLVSNKKLAGDNPKDFWRNVKFLDVQKRGRSQAEFLKLFAIPLKNETGLDLANCGGQPACYVYLDDGIFTGMTLIQSLSDWVKTEAPQNALLHVIVIAGHVGGAHYAETKLQEAAKAAAKTVQFHWWALLPLEDRKVNINTSDVLRPVVIPNDQRSQAYAASLRFPPVLRVAGNVGTHKIFSSEEGRNVLEQQFLIKGAYIKEVAPKLPRYARPLGRHGP
jgi:hypothetical protein